MRVRLPHGMPKLPNGSMMRKRRIKYIAVAVTLLLIIGLCRGCYNIFVNAEQEVFTSTQGTNTIIVQYDFMSRPTVYKKRLLLDKELWAYPGSGFMETVHFNVEWLSEDKFRISYDDEADEYDEDFIIEIP